MEYEEPPPQARAALSSRKMELSHSVRAFRLTGDTSTVVSPSFSSSPSAACSRLEDDEDEEFLRRARPLSGDDFESKGARNDRLVMGGSSASRTSKGLALSQSQGPSILVHDKALEEGSHYMVPEPMTLTPEGQGPEKEAQKEEGRGEKSARLPRQYWLDWCRTQSVWNVVCGHVWWTVSDETQYRESGNERYSLPDIGNNKVNVVAKDEIADRVYRNNQLFSNVFLVFTNMSPEKARARENSNMWEYIVEQGTLHTIPLFFLLSGYISALGSARHGQKTDASKHASEKLEAYLGDGAEPGQSTKGSSGEPRVQKWKSTIIDGLATAFLNPARGVSTPSPEGQESSMETSSVGEAFFPTFTWRRFQRLIFPFIFGTVCCVIPRALMLNDLGALTVVQSEMYFLYTLWGFASMNYAWCQYGQYYKALFELLFVQNLAKGEQPSGGEQGSLESAAYVNARTAFLAKWCCIYGLVAIMINWSIPFLCSAIFSDDDLQSWWYLSLGLTCTLCMMLQGVALILLRSQLSASASSRASPASGSSSAAVSSSETAKKGQEPDQKTRKVSSVEKKLPSTGVLVAQGCLFSSVMLFIPMTFVLADPKLKVDDEWEWLSCNMWLVFMLFEFLYMFGYFLGLFQSHIAFLRRTLFPPHTFGVVLLLASAVWPIFTYWGARTARRIGPWISFYDEQQRLLGLMRAWAWMGALAGFAYFFCNGPVHPWIHRHLTQSAMIVYMFHRLLEHLWLEVLLGHGEERGAVTWSCITLVLLSCFAIYAILNTNFVTRKMFGIDSVK